MCVLFIIGLALASSIYENLGEMSHCELAPENIGALDPGVLSWPSTNLYITLANYKHTLMAGLGKSALATCYTHCMSGKACAPSVLSCYRYCNMCRHNAPAPPHNCITANCTKFGFQ